MTDLLETARQLEAAANRASEAVNLALLADPAGNIGRWVAVTLSEGRSDGVVYDSRLLAIDHQLHPTQCAYILIDPMGLPVNAAARLLVAYRRLYDEHGGVPITDVDIRQTFQGPV